MSMKDLIKGIYETYLLNLKGLKGIISCSDCFVSQVGNPRYIQDIGQHNYNYILCDCTYVHESSM